LPIAGATELAPLKRELNAISKSFLLLFFKKEVLPFLSTLIPPWEVFPYMQPLPTRPKLLVPRPDLLRAFAVMWIPLSLAFIAFRLWRESRVGWTAGSGNAAFGDDSINFWSGPRLAVLGRTADIFSLERYHDFQVATLGGPIHQYYYGYPPAATLLTLPLGFLPYLAAWAVWVAGGWLAFAFVARAAWPAAARNRIDIALYALAVPALLLNGMCGQTGTWIAAIFGGGLLLLERRPVVAGILLGFLIAKPQMALLVPVALVAGQKWRSLAAMCASAATLVATSAALFGIDRWFEFADRLAFLRKSMMEDGTPMWNFMITIFVMLRHIPLPVSISYAGQSAGALVGVALVALVWRSAASAPVKYAVLVSCSLLVTPYVMVYDLVLAALVPLWLLQGGARGPNFDRAILLSSGLLLILPVVAPVVVNTFGIQIGPLMFMPAIVVAALAAMSEGSSSFLKKRTKKLLSVTGSP